MKKTILFFLIKGLLLLILSSCSNELDSVYENEGDFKEPYISSQMQEIIEISESHNDSVLQIGTICPILNLNPTVLYKENDIYPKHITPRAAELNYFYGRTGQKTLIYDQPIKFSSEQLATWYNYLGENRDLFEAGTTYYLTTIAVTFEIFDSRQILASSKCDILMGINPDDLISIGYHIDKSIPGLYTLTSYVYAIRIKANSNYLYSFIPSNFQTINDTFKLEWYYILY